MAFANPIACDPLRIAEVQTESGALCCRRKLFARCTQREFYLVVPPNNPGIIVDFRAFGLSTGGLEGAERHFRDCMAAFGIPYVETQLRVARAGFAVDVLDPWFEPDREALVVPPGAKITEYTGVAETATVSSGSRVVGLRTGAIANRQLAIYDKRTEVIQTKKMGWLTIWNAALAAPERQLWRIATRHRNSAFGRLLRASCRRCASATLVLLCRVLPLCFHCHSANAECHPKVARKLLITTVLLVSGGRNQRCRTQLTCRVRGKNKLDV